MIKNQEPLSVVEAEEIFDKSNTTKDLKAYFKKFGSLKLADAKKLKEELENSGIAKLKADLNAKIIDLLPADSEDLNKIFADISLDKNESDKILEIVKKYK
jgi:DNA-directed RNA polymerase subunit F